MERQDLPIENSPYRPHTPGYDYHEAGIYLVTLVVTGRERRLSVLNDNAEAPDVVLTDTGRIVQEEWLKTADIQAQKGRDIETLCQVCMPDHWHGVIAVRRRMDISVGTIINAFKSVCTSRWRKEVTGYVQAPCTATMIRHMNKDRRRAYYATRPLLERPLFDDDYDDTICMNEEHRRRMVAYVADNPRRAILRRLNPQYMQQWMHITIGGYDCAAFGNLFLLGWVRKQQVFCHRYARLSQLSPDERLQHGYGHLTSYTADEEERFVTRVPYHTTQAFRNQGNDHYRSVMAGATVLVTPGISEGEKRIKNMALERGLPLIHIQRVPILHHQKPEGQRFEACVRGRLLIITPWSVSALGEVNGFPSQSDYAQFHNLNKVAEAVCNA